jgi:hypothetical protein
MWGGESRGQADHGRRRLGEAAVWILRGERSGMRKVVHKALLQV